MFLWDLHFVYRLVVNPFCYVLYLLSCLTPRTTRRMAFGSSQFEFNGNAKYLFIYMNDHFPDLDLAWITTRRAVRDKLRTLGYKAYLRYEPRGLIHCLTARFYVYHGRPTDINYWTSGRVIDVNLWHGVGLKGLGFNSTSPLNRKNFNSRSVLRRFAKPWLFKKPSYFVSTTPLMTDYFARSFLITAEQCWEYGYSRSDHFFLPADERYRYLQKHEPPEVVEFIDSLAAYSKVYLYMPTYRDNMENFIKKAGIDYARLNDAMVARNALFVFKLHPWTRINLRELARYSNLIVVDSRLDPYTFLPYADVLITDYSSIYYDYLLLDKGIILFPFDYEKYISVNCDLVFDYDEYTPGKRATDFDELMAAIEEDDVGRTAEQERIKTLFWGEYKGDASKRIAEHIVRLMQE